VIYDLHCHSSASDGALDPDALLLHAAESGVDALAITDHDTLAAFDRIVTPYTVPRLIPGIELSTTWRNIGVHIVGLNGTNAPVSSPGGCARRGFRTCSTPSCTSPTENLQAGHTSPSTWSVPGSQKTRLGAGKPGDVRHCWASLPEVVNWIVQSGGSAVLAHPAKYRLTKTKLRALSADFRRAGGTAIEVVCGQQSRNTTTHLAQLSRDLDLAASCGSDFHSGDNCWSRPGGFAPLPDDVRPVWTTWQTHSK
jgi:predicted metal-dependent phosphoesterase TrpH